MQAAQGHLMGAYEIARALPMQEGMFRAPKHGATRAVRPQDLIKR